MPIVNDAHRAQIGSFHNLANSHQRLGNDSHQFRELLDVSNTTAVSSSRGVYHALSVEEGNSAEGSGNHVAAGGIGAALKRRPLVTGIVLTGVVLGVAGLASRTLPGSSVSVASLPDGTAPSEHWSHFDRGLSDSDGRAGGVPQPERLTMPAGPSAKDETLVGVCEQAIEQFSRLNHVPVDRTSIKELNSIHGDSTKILAMAQNMVQDDAAGVLELEYAAQCSGVRLRQNEVEVMIAKLETMKSGLQQQDGLSIDMPLNILQLQDRVHEIDRRLLVLREISTDLYRATVAINSKVLSSIG